MPAAAIEFGGEEHFDTTPDRLYAVLTDLDIVANNIPDLKSSERVDERTLRCVVRPGFAFIRGTMKLTITMDELNPPESATMRIDAKGIGAKFRVESHFEISSDGAGSLLKWKADIPQMSGLVATISPALLRGAADQVIRQGWEKTRLSLAG